MRCYPTRFTFGDEIADLPLSRTEPLTGLDLDRLADAVVPPEPHWLDLGILHAGQAEILAGLAAGKITPQVALLLLDYAHWGDFATCVANGMSRETIRSYMRCDKRETERRYGQFFELLVLLREQYEAKTDFLPIFPDFEPGEAANSLPSRRPAVSTSWVADPLPGRDYGPLPVSPPRVSRCVQYTVYEVLVDGECRAECSTSEQAWDRYRNLRSACRKAGRKLEVQQVEYIDAP